MKKQKNHSDFMKILDLKTYLLFYVKQLKLVNKILRGYMNKDRID